MFIRKGLVIGLIFLFIVQTITVNIYGNSNKTDIDNKLIDVTINFCGIQCLKSNTIKLTEENANKLDKIFENIRHKMNNEKSKEDTTKIFNEAIEEIADLGLFPKRLSVKLIKNFVNSKNSNNLNINLNEKMNTYTLEDYNNSNCNIVGVTTNTIFIPYRWYLLDNILDSISNNQIRTFFYALAGFTHKIQEYIPISINSFITFGMNHTFNPYEPPEYYPSNGWVKTVGDNGQVDWDGSFYGHSFNFFINFNFLTGTNKRCIGATGFRGIYFITGSFDTQNTKAYFLGKASQVKIGDYYTE